MNENIVAQQQILEEAFVIHFHALENSEDRLAVLAWMTSLEKIGGYLFFAGGTIEMISRSVAEDVLIRRFVLSFADSARLLFAIEKIPFFETLVENCIVPNMLRYQKHDVALLPSSVRAELRIGSADLKALTESSDWYLFLYALFVTGAFKNFSATQETE
jgi:hypothetical protein